MLKDKIKEKAGSLLGEVISARRHLHANPELSFREKETSLFIQKQLTAWGIPFQAGFAGTGISVILKGKDPDSRLRALRADMDALPITEENETEYTSRNAGVMHACGHDVHSASLLGTAAILHSLRDEWRGSIQLIFQPGEEVLPGGASLMLKENVFPKLPSAILAQHVYPELPAGKVGFRPGMYMASTDELYLVVKGRGGHAAKPDKLIDPILITAHLLIALQQVVGRWANPQTPTVLSFGKVIANGATNVIPNEVRIEGTFRTFDETWRNDAHRRMTDLARHVVTGMGGEIDFEIRRGYPVLNNDVDLTRQSMEQAAEYLGVDNVVSLDMRTTAEDFAYFSQQMPACFYRLGTASPDGRNSQPVHHSRFDIDESALQTGMGLMAWLAVQ